MYIRTPLYDSPLYYGHFDITDSFSSMGKALTLSLPLTTNKDN